MNDIEITFPEGQRVLARLDEPGLSGDAPGGRDAASAPTPIDLFLASLATCAGVFALGFCRTRGLDTQRLRLVQRHVRDEATGLLETVRIELHVPEGFPSRYEGAVVRAAADVASTIPGAPTLEVALVRDAAGEAVRAPTHGGC
ncbi:MAG TPA: OsmC family protein [Minicystis sp.]|nr:OsmC family protein [Minicystis sp.]